MNQADVVRRYLLDPRDVDFRDTGFPFITISRQAGTEAHALGRQILMRLAQGESTGFNPLQCAATPANLQFLVDWVKLLAGKPAYSASEDEDIRVRVMAADAALALLDEDRIPNAAAALCLGQFARRRAALLKDWKD